MICNRKSSPSRASYASGDAKDVEGDTEEDWQCASFSLKIDGVIKTLEEILENDSKSNGWHYVDDDDDTFAHYALSQIIYRRCEGPRSEKNECMFDLPDENDDVRILWKNGKAIGFYTLKLKGTYVERRHEFYEMVTLDTAYISSEYRRNGFGISILEDIQKNHPNQDIGFSSPIALPMLKVIEKFIGYYPQMKYKLWQITDAGCEGSKKLVWFTISRNKKNVRSYNKDSRSL